MRSDTIPSITLDDNTAPELSTPTTLEGTQEVIIQEFINPTNFSIINANEWTNIREIEHQIFLTLSERPREAVYPILQEVYAVMGGNMVSRGILTNIDQGEATLRLIDRGWTLMAPEEDLRILPYEFAIIPPFSTKAYLPNIKPKGTDLWDKDICLHLRRLLIDKQCLATIVAHHQLGVSVNLRYPESPISVADQLLEDGWAQRGQYQFRMRWDNTWATYDEEESDDSTSDEEFLEELER